MRRSGFTLIEVMVALVITGLVVSVAYASMQAGLDTSDRLADVQRGDEREIVARALIQNAIRHALPGSIGGQAVFTLTDSPAGDELRFRTRGVSEPLGATEVWEVELLTSSEGLQIVGHAVDEPSSSFAGVLPRVRRLDVRVRGRDYRDGWFEEWTISDRSPVAVSIAFLGPDGRSIGAPLVARIGLEGNP